MKQTETKNLLEQANENIDKLIDMLVIEHYSYNRGNCLRITLLGKDRVDCNSTDCHICNQKSIKEYKTMLLNEYQVKAK